MGLFDERTGGLVTYWKSVASITALVGSASNARIWPSKAAQGAELPYIVFTRAPGGKVFTHLRGTTGARLTVVHVYCYASTQSGADALAEAVKQNTQGSNMRGTQSGVVVNWVYGDEAPDDDTDNPQDASDTKRYWTRLILRIMHGESGGT